MNGTPDFRPEPGHRASDPSLEDMLRRARDARLGDAINHDRTTPLTYEPPPHERRDSRLRDWLLVAAGVLVGVLLSIAVVNVAVTVRSWTASASSVAPTATRAISAVPTSTPTAIPTVTPTATPVPTATTVEVAPPTTDEVISLVRDFYDNQGPYAGSYLMLDVTRLQIQGQDETQLMVCINYEAASVTAPESVTYSNTRLFTLATDSDRSWHVMQMGGSGSCSTS